MRPSSIDTTLQANTHNTGGSSRSIAIPGKRRNNKLAWSVFGEQTSSTRKIADISNDTKRTLPNETDEKASHVSNNEDTVEVSPTLEVAIATAVEETGTLSSPNPADDGEWKDQAEEVPQSGQQYETVFGISEDGDKEIDTKKAARSNDLEEELVVASEDNGGEHFSEKAEETEGNENKMDPAAPIESKTDTVEKQELHFEAVEASETDNVDPAALIESKTDAEEKQVLDAEAVEVSETENEDPAASVEVATDGEKKRELHYGDVEAPETYDANPAASVKAATLEVAVDEIQAETKEVQPEKAGESPVTLTVTVNGITSNTVVEEKDDNDDGDNDVAVETENAATVAASLDMLDQIDVLTSLKEEEAPSKSMNGSIRFDDSCNVVHEYETDVAAEHTDRLPLWWMEGVPHDTLQEEDVDSQIDIGYFPPPSPVSATDMETTCMAAEEAAD
jgi:hypothetical protein